MVLEGLVSDFVAIVDRIAALSDSDVDRFIIMLDKEDVNPHGLEVIQHFIGEEE